ncbi:S-adenosyl-L-methionine-dependent methyltransferase [Poronia punctata]|nr:S-adenosyl-L-methionine-dependent methyltransferase [Poronia punctata]
MDASDINRSIFNQEAADYDNKHRKLNDRLTREIQARLDFIAVDWVSDDEDSDEEVEEGGEGNKPRREVRLLDYACGTGMISRALAPYTTQCVGMDISENMVAAYNARAEMQGLSRSEMHAIVGDLASPTVSDDLMSEDLSNFDIAVVGGGFHHFGDPELAAKRLVERLKPGGVLLVWDFLPHGPPPSSSSSSHGHEHEHGHSHNHHHHNNSQSNVFHSVMHHGFSKERIREIFISAGAGTDYALEVVGGGLAFASGHGHGHEEGLREVVDQSEKESGENRGFRREVFFARGTKAL